jgi:hypothetical protein
LATFCLYPEHGLRRYLDPQGIDPLPALASKPMLETLRMVGSTYFPSSGWGDGKSSHAISCDKVHIHNNKAQIGYIYNLVGGIATPVKNMKVSWGYDIPNIWKVIKVTFQTTNQ